MSSSSNSYSYTYTAQAPTPESPFTVTVTIRMKPKAPAPPASPAPPAPPAKRSIYIGNISRFASREQIHDAIERIVGMYGDLEDIRVPIHLDSGRPLGYAFAIFKNPADASKFMAYAADIGGCGDLRRALDIDLCGVRDPEAHVKIGYAKQQ